MEKTLSSIVWIVPSYEDIKRGREFLFQLCQQLKNHLSLKDWHVIIVDDGSQVNQVDQESYVKVLKEEYGKRLSVVTLAENHGKGYAVRAGWNGVNEFDFYAFADMDGSVSADECIRLMIKAFDFEQGIDLLVASRMNASRTKRSFHRRYMAKILHIFLSKYLPLSVQDTQCGCKILSKKLRDYSLQHSEVDRFAFDIEIIAQARWLGMKVQEEAVKWDEMQGSTFRLASLVQGLKDILSIKRKYS